MSTIIQFMHPGTEHSISSGTNWNTGDHKRKYLKIQGEYLDNFLIKPKCDTVYFWGEWEAQSEATPIDNNDSDLPKNIFSPYYKLPSGTPNTDPFVFGNNFYYCVCKQGHYPSLRNLNKGDIILFGSSKHDNFVLDTLFVVKGCYEYELNEIPKLKTKYNKPFFDVSLEPLHNYFCVPAITIVNTNGSCLPQNSNEDDERKPSVEVTKYRIYEAAMFEDRHDFNGIFSYAPCMSAEKGAKGFKRPIIKDCDFITENQRQGLKITPNSDSLKVWNEVTKQVLEHGLNLLIKTDLPTIK